MRAKHKERICFWAIQGGRESELVIRPFPAATFTPASVISYPISLLPTPTMVHHRGDDLEDDFMPDETVALSEDEGFGSLVGDQEDVAKLLSADEDEKAGVKSPNERAKPPSEEKKRKRREKEKERKEKECPPPTS